MYKGGKNGGKKLSIALQHNSATRESHLLRLRQRRSPIPPKVVKNGVGLRGRAFGEEGADATGWMRRVRGSRGRQKVAHAGGRVEEKKTRNLREISFVNYNRIASHEETRDCCPIFKPNQSSASTPIRTEK